MSPKKKPAKKRVEIRGDGLRINQTGGGCTPVYAVVVKMTDGRRVKIVQRAEIGYAKQIASRVRRALR